MGGKMRRDKPPTERMSGQDNADRRLTLDQLPPELLGNIIEFVDAQSLCEELPKYNHAQHRLNVLCRTSLVSKALYEATKPCLYREVDITQLKKPIVRKFLRTLCGKPDLARLIKHLRLGEHVMQAKKAPSFGEFRSHNALLESTGNTDLHAEILESLMRGCPTAQNALILALATNVRSLDLKLADTSRRSRAECGQGKWLCSCCPNLAQCLGSILARDNGSFQVLRKLRLRSSSEQVQCTTYDIQRQLLRLPLLEEVILSAFCKSSASVTTPLPSTSNICKITLEYCTVDTSSVTCMIGSCKNLTELDIERPNGNLDGEQLLAALEEHSAHLERLTIRTSQEDRPLLQDNKPIGNLRTFERMQYLELDSDILTGTSQWDSRSLSISDLPLSMKCLQINTYSHLSDLEFILRSLQSKISSSLDLLKVTFPCNRLINREYVDVIQEEDFWENGDPRVRADKGWSIIVTFSIQDYCLQFSCWKDDTSIADKIGRLVEQVKSAGIENLLEDYYADWIIAEGNQMNYIRESLWRDEEEGG